MCKPMIAPSILSADFADLKGAISLIENHIDPHFRADWLHVDVMDNHFVPNLTLGLPVVESLLRITEIPMDCHLMIENPERWAPLYAEAGAYNVSIHAEATEHPISVAKAIQSAGARAGLAIKPETDIEDYCEILQAFDTVLIMSVEPGFGGQKFIESVLSKVRWLRSKISAEELDILIEIDGGINERTIELAATAGVQCFVAGSAIYNTANPALAISLLRDQAQKAAATHEHN